MMRLQFVAIISLLTLFMNPVAMSQDLPAPSPLGVVEQRVGLTDIKITYSRPGAKGRKVFGDVVPFGQMWRTGANRATKIEFSTPVKINGVELAAGTYAIFTIPMEKEHWTIIFNRNVNQSGTSGYSQDMDALRIKVPAKEAGMRETMTFTIDEVKDNSAVIELHWEKTAVSIPVQVDYMKNAEENIDGELKKLAAAFGTYNRIARFYVDNNIKLAEALEYSNKSVSMEKKFWNVYTLSLVQAANKMYAEAIASANLSKQLAEADKNPEYVKMNVSNIEKWSKIK